MVKPVDPNEKHIFLKILCCQFIMALSGIQLGNFYFSIKTWFMPLWIFVRLSILIRSIAASSTLKAVVSSSPCACSAGEKSTKTVAQSAPCLFVKKPVIFFSGQSPLMMLSDSVNMFFQQFPIIIITASRSTPFAINWRNYAGSSIYQDAVRINSGKPSGQH